AYAVLLVGGHLVDGWHHRSGNRIGLLARVDGQGFEAVLVSHDSIPFVGTRCSRRGRSARPGGWAVRVGSRSRAPAPPRPVPARGPRGRPARPGRRSAAAPTCARLPGRTAWPGRPPGRRAGPALPPTQPPRRPSPAALP